MLISASSRSLRMRIPLPPPDAPLSALRAAIQERTGVAPEHQKLIVGGAVMQKGEDFHSMLFLVGLDITRNPN